MILLPLLKSFSLQNMDTRKRGRLILILGLLSAIGPFSIDMYLPGFPAIAADLHTTVDYVSYSLSSFFIGICVGQLICGLCWIASLEVTPWGLWQELG